MRSVRRLTRFMETKPDVLSIQKLKSINNISHLSKSVTIETDIPPVKKQLSLVTFSSVSIPTLPAPKFSTKLSIEQVSVSDLPPDPFPCLCCKLVSPLPNLPRTPSGPVPMCSVCTMPVDDRFDPHSCCGQLMHQLCWGDQPCDGWI